MSTGSPVTADRPIRACGNRDPGSGDRRHLAQDKVADPAAASRGPWAWRRRRVALAGWCCLLACTGYCRPALSTVLSVADPGSFLDSYGANPIGNGPRLGSTGFYAGGLYDSVHVSVTPNPTSSPSSLATSVTATQGSTVINIPFLGGSAFPDQYYKNVPFVPHASPTGAWTLTIANPTTSGSPQTVDTPPLSVTSPPTKVTGISMTRNASGLTLDWTVPAGSTATAETVYAFNVLPRGSSGGAAVASRVLPAGTSSYTFPGLSVGARYSFSVQSDIWSGGTTGTLEARSRQFTGAVPVSAVPVSTSTYLPSVLSHLSSYGGLIYSFDDPVTAGKPILIDPTVATGFIYRTGSSDPNFASVELPDIGNPSPYDLYLWNGTDFTFSTTLAANTRFDFATGGVSAFEILGIDPGRGLDPTDAIGFATQLTFVGSGAFTGTMTPVTQQVPEPSTLVMCGVALAWLGAARLRPTRTVPRGSSRRACAAPGQPDGGRRAGAVRACR